MLASVLGWTQCVHTSGSLAMSRWAPTSLYLLGFGTSPLTSFPSGLHVDALSFPSRAAAESMSSQPIQQEESLPPGVLGGGCVGEQVFVPSTELFL